MDRSNSLASASLVAESVVSKPVIFSVRRHEQHHRGGNPRKHALGSDREAEGGGQEHHHDLSNHALVEISLHGESRPVAPRSSS
jgi:hypothetical protein